MSELSAKQKTMDYILNILRERYAVEDYKLPTEAELSTKLNVSRNSIRETLKTLQNIGLIYSVRGSGYKVCSDIENTLLKTTQLLLDIMPDTYNYKDISDIRETLEIKILTLLQKEDINQDDIVFLRQCIENMKNNIEPEKNDQDFHMKLASMSGNPLIRVVSLAILFHVSKKYILIPWDKINEEEKEKLIASHEKIIEWILQETPSIINENPISCHYELADSIIYAQNKLYDNASLANMTISELLDLGITDDEISRIIQEIQNTKSAN